MARSPSLEKEKIAGVIENRGHVAGDEVFILAQSDYDGRAVARGDNLVGSSVAITTSAKTPVSCLTVLRTASSSDGRCPLPVFR
jgi:hypothetical protein